MHVVVLPVIIGALAYVCDIGKRGCVSVSAHSPTMAARRPARKRVDTREADRWTEDKASSWL